MAGGRGWATGWLDGTPHCEKLMPNPTDGMDLSRPTLLLEMAGRCGFMRVGDEIQRVPIIAWRVAGDSLLALYYDTDSGLLVTEDELPGNILGIALPTWEIGFHMDGSSVLSPPPPDKGLEAVAYALRCLGNGNASTHMGAIENLAVKVEEASLAIADAIAGVAGTVGTAAE